MKKMNTYWVLGLLAFLYFGIGCQSASIQNSTSSKETTQSTAPKLAEHELVANNITSIISASKDHSTLLEAMKISGIESVLEGNGAYTFFAPNNAAFDILPEATKAFMLNSKTKFKSNSVLSYHLVVGKFKLADLKDGQVLTTKHGGTLKIVFKDGSPTVNGAKMTTTDIEAGNGVVHMIDAVLLPALQK
jgi:uncharacterized surface protein with fasciclin (FAS1) repeats